MQKRIQFVGGPKDGFKVVVITKTPPFIIDLEHNFKKVRYILSKKMIKGKEKFIYVLSK